MTLQTGVNYIMGTRTFISKQCSLADSCASTVNIHTKLHVLLLPLHLFHVDVNSSNSVSRVTKLVQKILFGLTRRTSDSNTHPFFLVQHIHTFVLSLHFWQAFINSGEFLLQFVQLAILFLQWCFLHVCQESVSLLGQVVAQQVLQLVLLSLQLRHTNAQIAQAVSPPRSWTAYLSLSVDVFTAQSWLKNKKAVMLQFLVNDTSGANTHTKQKRCAAA